MFQGNVLSIRIFFFFWIGNEKKIIKKKIANLSTLRMYYGAKIKNQNYNDQVKQEGKKIKMRQSHTPIN